MTEQGREWGGGFRRKRALLMAVGAAFLLALVWAGSRRTGGDEEEVSAVVDVRTARVVVRDLQVQLSVLGTVDARPGHEAHLAAPAQTRVARIDVGTGDRVASGQVLVALDESVWRVQTEQARAGLQAAEQAHARAERLVAEGVAPRKEEEAAAADLAQARAALAEARRTQSLGVLRSPIAGVVTAMRAHLGQMVDANVPLVEVVDPSGLEVLFHLSPDEAARVSEGDAVELRSGPDSASALVGRGSVRGVSAAVDSTSGSVQVRATVEAPARPLRVGESVSGLITVQRIEEAMVVPAAAVVPAAGGGLQVWVVDTAGSAHAAPVTVGARAVGAVQIVSGLRGDETVVTEGAYGVTDGSAVRAAASEP